MRKPHGPRGVRKLGHRGYVGGAWDAMGRLQFEYVRGEGLMPEHYFLDVGCGCLRGGVHFVRYLEPGRYMGMDKEASLLSAGLKELGDPSKREKRPCLMRSDEFEFSLFDRRPNVALAQSLFTHLTPPMISMCLHNLRERIADGGVFHATFFECERPTQNPSTPHDHRRFTYARSEMEKFGTDAGWEPRYVGAWGHPAGQVMMEYRP